MQTISTIQCYDVLDKIHVSVQVRQQEHPESDWETVMLEFASVTSDGESRPREWLRDCLIALVELL